MGSTSLGAGRQRETVRELASKVAELAASPRYAAIHRRWRDVNALRRPDRFPVWCKPVGAWGELLPAGSLECAEEPYRTMETYLRRVLIKDEIGDDSPLEPWFRVPAVLDVEPANLWGVDVEKRHSGREGGAWSYDPPLRTVEDFAALRIPRFSYNAARTEEALERADGVLGDILPVRRVCFEPLSATIGNYAGDLYGLSELMLGMALEPELMHRLMAYVRDSVLAAMDQVEAAGVLTPNNTTPMLASDPLGPEPADGACTFRHLWCMANSQEFDAVSPAMWEEFCLEYQRPIMDRYGLVCYGCCENLTHKIDGVLSIPNLRIFTCSAWTDLDVVLEAVGTDTVIMWRQKAGDVVLPEDVDTIRRDLMEGAERLQGTYTQIVLRELQTLMGHPHRLHEWTRCAIEAAERYA